ncbi:enoyl-CoA hydratase [soil metagenome]
MTVSIVPPMPDPHFEAIRVDRTEGVVTITLDRPERKNALNGAMTRELKAVLTEVSASAEDRVLVITGADGAFCSGADLGDRDGQTAAANSLAHMRDLHGPAQLLHDVPQPTLARINGVAAGAGLNLALGCDLTIASTEARFSQIFARRGLSTDFGGAWLLPRLIGLHRAKELALLADIVPAEEAHRLGLVNRVVPPEELDALVDDWASRLAAGPPIALTQTKRMLNRSFETAYEAQLEAESTAQSYNFSTADTVEALRAFSEKRPPEFHGR